VFIAFTNIQQRLKEPQTGEPRQRGKIPTRLLGYAIQHRLEKETSVVPQVKPVTGRKRLYQMRQFNQVHGPVVSGNGELRPVRRNRLPRA
jgi:hypothetical protein